MRVHGQITEVKQLKTNLILRWVTIWDPNILSFSVWLWLAKILGKLGNFAKFYYQFGFQKTQMFSFENF